MALLGKESLTAMKHRLLCFGMILVYFSFIVVALILSQWKISKSFEEERLPIRERHETTISETKVPAVMTSIKPETTNAASIPTTDLATTATSTTTEATTTTIKPETITPNNTMNTTLSQNSKSETNSTMNGTLVSASNVTSNFTAMNSTANEKNTGNATALSSTAAPKNYTTPGTTTAIPSTTAASTTASTTATTTSGTTTTTQPATTTAITTSNPTTTKATTKATTTQATTTSLATTTTTTTTTNPPTTTLEPWHQKYYGLGCYKSHEDDTNFPILVINLRPFIDWSNMTKTIEACAKEVIKPATRALHGVDFTFFAIRFFAECWANGETASTTYFSLGHADDCYMMTGAEWSYYVYRYGPATRPAMKPYNSLGCYRSTANAVPIRHLIGTYGNSSDPVTADSIARIKADCAKEALNRGYTTFGILNGGECWSGPNAHNSYDDDGAAASCANGLGSVGAYNVYQFTS